MPDTNRSPHAKHNGLTILPTSKRRRCASPDFDLATPIGDLAENVREILLYGTGGEELTLHYDTNRGAGVLRRPFEGIVCNLERRYQETQSEAMRIARTAWQRRPARTAMVPGCGRRCWPSRSAG